MLRKILVPLDTSKYTPVATRVAAEIANAVTGKLGRPAVTLQGLGIVDLDQFPGGRFAELVPRDELLAESHAKVQALVNEFREAARRYDIPAAQIETRVTEGSPFVKIVHHHAFCDLVVMGTRCSFPPAVNDYETLVHLLYGVSRPVLIVSDKPRPFKTVALVMDGTASASRMLYALAHLNPFPDARVLVVHSSYEERYHELKDFFDRVDDYLTSFNFQVEQVRIDGHLLQELPSLVLTRKLDAVALGIHAEGTLHKLGTPLHLFNLPLENLLEESHVALFTVS